MTKPPHYTKELNTMKKNTNINEVIKELKEYQDMADALKIEIEALKEQAIEYMTEHELDEVLTDEGKITYREVISQRFQTTEFKKKFMELYKAYTKPTSCMKFTCN